MLAMDFNDDAGNLNKRGDGTFFASMLAPTVDRCRPWTSPEP